MWKSTAGKVTKSINIGLPLTRSHTALVAQLAACLSYRTIEYNTRVQESRCRLLTLDIRTYPLDRSCLCHGFKIFNVNKQLIHNFAYLLYSNMHRSCFGYPLDHVLDIPCVI